MLNQHGYGKMDVDPVPQEGGPVWGVCAKCKAKFLLEKPHNEIHVNEMSFRRKPDKTLVPSKPTNVKFHRFCTACVRKFEEWIGA